MSNKTAQEALLGGDRSDFSVCSDGFSAVVTHQVHHHVFVKRGSPLGGHLADIDDGLWVVGVDVEDGGVDDPGDIGGIGGGARHAGVCGEADLQKQDAYKRTGGGKTWLCFVWLPGC